MYKTLWVQNVRALLAENNMTVAEAARLLGTSKQYLTTILGENEPQSTKEQVIESLSVLLHAHPSKLYSPLSSAPEQAGESSSVGWQLLDMPASAVEQAVLAERHYLGGNYRGSLAFVSHLLTEHGNDLMPIALAQARLLAGKSTCLLGQAGAAKEFLQAAKRFFQKRISAQPQKHLPLFLDCCRYLALAAHLEQDYVEAMKVQRQAMRLAVKYHRQEEGTDIKWETLGKNMLGTATKQGRLAAICDVAEELGILAQQIDNLALAQRAVFAREFAQYAVARAQGVSCQIQMTPPLATEDALLILQFGLVEWDKGGNLSAFVETLTQYDDDTDYCLAINWLRSLNSPGGAEPEISATLPLKPLSLFLSVCVAQEAEQEEAFHLWQEALFGLKSNREFPLYLFAFAVGLEKFATFVGEHNKHVLAGVLKRAVASFTE